MKRKTSVAVTATLIIFCFLCQPVLAVYPDTELETPSLDLREFLSEMEMDLDDYIRMMVSFAETGDYPHFIEKSADRYEAFAADNPNFSFDKVIAFVNVNADKGFYNDIQEVSNLDSVTLLVNKNFYLPREWVPDDFVQLGHGHKLREEAAGQYSLLKEAMDEAGLNLVLVASYRAYSTQATTHGNAVANYGWASADASFARAGHSEHQTGLVVDVLHRAPAGLMINSGFDNTAQYTWLRENAYKYGFILRYPAELRDIHGYIFEPWHWRYVGVDVATAMYNEGIILYEEFYGRYLAPDVLYSARERIIELRTFVEEEEYITAPGDDINDGELPIVEDDAIAAEQGEVVVLDNISIFTDAQEEQERPFLLVLLILSSVIIIVIIIISYKIINRKGKRSTASVNARRVEK